MASNCDEWYGCALVDQESEDEKVFVMLFVSKSPQLAWFLECREKAVIVPSAPLVDDARADTLGCYRQFEFLDPLVIVPDHKLPFHAKSAIAVYPDIVFQGDLLATYHAPVSFDVFVLYHPSAAPQKKKAAAAPRRRPSHDGIDKLLLEHDWLRKDDFVDEVVRPPPMKKRAKEPRSHDIPDEEESESDDASLAVSEASQPEQLYEPIGDEPPATDIRLELGATRNEVAQTVDDQPDLYFKIVTRGGQWTNNHTGKVADSVRGEARGELVKEWAKEYKWPATMTFSMRRYGREGAARLAKE